MKLKVPKFFLYFNSGGSGFKSHLGTYGGDICTIYIYIYHFQTEGQTRFLKNLTTIEQLIRLEGLIQVEENSFGKEV